MTQIETLLSDALRRKGFPFLTVEVRKDRNKYLTHFDVHDMLGHFLATYSAFGECSIYNAQDIDFIAFKIIQVLKNQFGGKQAWDSIK